jgi:5-hydroxyisourate hydrolase
MSGISTHVLDVAEGRPASGVWVELARRSGDAWFALATGVTDADGRCRELVTAEAVKAGAYKLTFRTGDYFLGRETLYPEVVIVFQVETDGRSYHIPLLLSPFGYTTYRGS